MPSLLLSGPAGSGKSQEARRLLAAGIMNGSGAPSLIIDYQSLLAALLQLERGPDGRYPPRGALAVALIPLVEELRIAAIREAQARELDVIVTNSNGDPARRAALLAVLGAGATETVIDPGRAVVVARLSDATGTLSAQCSEAIGRWYR